MTTRTFTILSLLQCGEEADQWGLMPFAYNARDTYGTSEDVKMEGHHAYLYADQETADRYNASDNSMVPDYTLPLRPEVYGEGQYVLIWTLD